MYTNTVDVIMYTVCGSGTLIVNEGFESKFRKHDIGAGDFAFVPAWTEHQVVNKSSQDLVCAAGHGQLAQLWTTGAVMKPPRGTNGVTMNQNMRHDIDKLCIYRSLSFVTSSPSHHSPR
jgi:oxalate decarboxylase/phosphoglucose isomerase-like protein (cupin superfamily)